MAISTVYTYGGLLRPRLEMVEKNYKKIKTDDLDAGSTLVYVGDFKQSVSIS